MAFKRLTDNQKNLLFVSWCELPTSEDIKRWYTRRAGEPVISESDAKDFQKLGYSKAQIGRIREQLENAGYRQSD